MYQSFLRLIGLNPAIATLTFMTMLAHITLSGGRVTSSLYVLQHDGSAAAAGVVYSLYFLLPALLSVHMGKWIDRVGSSYAMRLSLIGMAASLVLASAWPIMATIFACALLGGLCFACFVLAANVSISYMPLERESDRIGMLAWLQMGTSVSAVVGPALAGILIDGSGFRAAYTAMMAFVVLGLGIALRAKLSDEHAVKDLVRGHGMARLLIDDLVLRRIFFLTITISMAWEAFAFMTPLVGHERGYSATSIGFILSAFAVGTFISRASLQWLAKRWSEWRTLSASAALSATVFFLLAWNHSALLHVVLGFVFGLSAGVNQPNLLGLLYRTMPKGRAGEGAGLRSMVSSVVGLITPSMYGAIAGLVGAAPVFLGVCVMMSASSWSANQGRKRDAAQQEAAALDDKP